ncbi:GntR family transcriptional regulator [Streptomyces sp. adm13(2018)]|uniref:GntR family transcriptional regulator n=1 Tax=Streptomyces sp. adm13(2018) TaxID=2479007 RepID=UPI0016501F00|nr:GntR family transcriptional regulator [Streptomyces sp. adm13(2018)]
MRVGRTVGTPADAGRAVPRYVQIADEIVQQIRSGVLKAGDMVPSESELVERYGVAGGTIRKAMVEVRASGLVETRHGKGSIVKDRPPVRLRSSDRFRASHRRGGKAAYLAESEQSGATAKVSVLYIGPMEAPADIAERLGVDVGTQVLARRRLYFRNGTPVETASSYLPWDVVKDIPELFAENPGPGGIYARLEGHGHTFTEFVETLQARPASKAESSELALSPGAPVVHLLRDAVTKKGRVVEVCDTLMAADQFVFQYRIPATD